MVKSSIKKIKRTKTKILKILMLVGYSSGASGVWQRCKDEAIAFAKQGHIVVIFSSNAIKGKPGERAEEFDVLKGQGYHINIKRFPYRKLGGESYMSWNFKKDAIEYDPTIILTHSYRHTHSDKAIKIAQRLKCICICITHAPFVQERSLPAKIIVAIKDYFSNIDYYDKVIAISKWEIPIIKELGVLPQKIKRIPNPIFDRYFEGPINPGKGILYLGRYHPIKDLKTLVIGVALSLDFNNITFVGSGEQREIDDIKFVERINKIDINWNVPVYDLEKKIKIYDDHEIFVLPSLREAMPIALVEAMARGKIVVASRTDGSKELIINNKNGFLFNIGDHEELAVILDKISKIPEKSKQKIREEARASVKERCMSDVMKTWNSVISKFPTAHIS